MDKSNIMVVEDSGIVLLDIQKSLKSFGYTVVATASSKDEAIRKADETRPDLILMDIRLGEEMGGIEAADHIRENFNIPIVFLTGYADEDTFQRAKITDPFGYILKPFDPKGLRTTIEIALHNHELKSQLHESEKRYRTLVETMNDGVGQVDAEGKLIFVNDRLCQMIGFSRDEILGRDHMSLFPKDQYVLQQEEFEKRKGGEANSFETLLARKDGGTIPVILSGSPVIDHAGNFVSTIGVFTDISDRKRAEDDVRKSKQALEEAERQVHMGHYEIDTVSGEAVWSEETFNIFGLDPESSEPTVEIYNKLIHPDDVSKVYALYEKCVQQGVPFNLVYRIVRPNGEVRYVHSNARTLTGDDGMTTKLFGTFQDVTEIKQVELALQESETLYHDLVETAQDLIWQCDREGRYIYLNPAWEEVFGYSLDEMLGKPFTDFQSPDYAQRDMETFTHLLNGYSVAQYETVHLGKNGQELQLVFNAKAVRDSQKNVIGTRGTAYDITERKRAETALAKSGNLLRESQKIARIGHYDLDVQSGLWESSEGLNEIFGIDWDFQTDVEGWLRIVHPDDREAMADYLAEEVVGKRQEFDREYRITRADDGKTRWVHGLGRLNFDNDGKPIHMIGNIQDITERKHAEEALRESEERMRLLASAAHEGIGFSEEGKVIEANEQLAHMLGCELSELIGKSAMEFVAPESRALVLEKIRSGANEPYEHLAIKKDGTIFPVEVRPQMMTVQGRQVRVTAILDVTERKQAGEMLAQERQRLANVIEGTNVGTWEWNVQTGETIFNERWAEIIGYSLEEISPVSIDTWMKFSHPDDLKLSNDLLEKNFNGELDYYECEARMLHKDGGWVWVLDRGKVASWTEDGKPLIMSGTHQDITERKQAELALKAKTRELEALFSISAHLRTAQSADDMLPVVLTEMRRVLYSDANAVILLDSDNEHFTFAVSDGSLAVNNEMQLNVRNSISGLVLQTRRPYATKDFSSDPNKAATLQGDNDLGPAIFAPVISESEFLGVLLCAREKADEVREFSESDVQLLTAVGEMVGNALRRARLYDQALTRLQHVQTLHSIDMAISANLDLAVILDVLLTQGVAQLDADAASILLLNPHTHMLEYAAGNGFHTKEIKSARLRLGEGLPGQAAMDRKILHTTNLSKVNNLIRKHLLDEGFVSYQAAPLIAKGQLQGVLEIFNRNLIKLDDEQTGFLETLATQAAIAIDNAQLFSDLQRSNFELEMAYDATIEGWSRALELRDQETEGHTLRVTDMTLRLAQAVGIRSRELAHIRRGALLHDIGKMGIPDRILLKPEKLSSREWEIMKQHPVYAFEMLWPIEFLRPAIDIPQCHHERWDGTGYPRMLKGEQIPLSARVFAVADVWDALTSNRPYRKKWTDEKALEYITTNAGKHFDPQVVNKFIELRNGDG